MTKLKIHVQVIERNHDGYCSDTGIDDLYDTQKETFVKEVETEPIPDEQFDANGNLKEEHWYDYVNWKKDEARGYVIYEYDLTDHHCSHCCHGTGYIYNIIKVEIIKDGRIS